MKRDTTFFKLYKKYGLEGYHIPVRNSFNNCIEYEFIPESARSLYEESFGEKVLSDQEFLDWYTQNATVFNS